MVVTYHKMNQYAESVGALGRGRPADRLVGAVPAVRAR